MSIEYKVEGFPDLIKRDGVVVNTNTESFLSFLENRDKALKKEQDHQDLKDRVAQLEALIEQLTKAK